MLEAIELHRQIEKGWPSKYEVMTEKQLADITYGAITSANYRIEAFLKDKLGEREQPYSHRGGNL